MPADIKSSSLDNGEDDYSYISEGRSDEQKINPLTENVMLPSQIRFCQSSREGALLRSVPVVEVNDDNIEKSRLIVGLHRVVENTHARRRLERWSLRVIAVYLAVVFALVLCTYAHIPFLRLPFIYIPDNIMIAILTTTTANIIGLGLIVLRGHFLANENNKESDSKKDTSNLSSEKKQSGSVQT